MHLNDFSLAWFRCALGRFGDWDFSARWLFAVGALGDRCRGLQEGGGLMASKELKSEFEVPPHMKVRIVATGNRKLCEEMEHIHE